LFVSCCFLFNYLRNYVMLGFMLFITLFVLFMPISLAGFNLISYICNRKFSLNFKTQQ